MIALLSLLACRQEPSSTDPVPRYDVPLAPDSPWPKFRRDSAQLARGLYGASTDGADEPWTFQTGKGIFSSPVIGGDGTIFVGSADRSLRALNPDGTERWAFETGEIIDSSALLDDQGRLYVGSGDGHLYALDAESGTEVWTFAADDPSVNNAFIHWFEGNVAMLSTGDLVVPNDNFFVYGIDRDTGEKNWAYRMFDQTWSLPAVDAATDRVFVGNNNLITGVSGNTFAIDGLTGQVAWSRMDALGSVAASPLLLDGTLVIGAFDGYVRGYEASGGALLWEVPVRDHVYASAAALSDGTVVVPSADGTVYALDPADGALRWAFDTPEPIRSSPAVGADDTIYVGGGDGRLYVLDPDGTLRWSMLLVDGDRNDLNASPALGPDGIVLASESGGIFLVPYDFCLEHEDPRCATGGEALEDDGVFLWPTTRWGSPRPEATSPLGPAEPIALSLFAREGGDSTLTLLGDVTVTVTPEVPVDVTLSADRRFLTVQPPASGWGVDAVSVRVVGGTVVEPSRVGLAFGSGSSGPPVDVTVGFEIDRSGPPLASTAPGSRWELWRLAAPLPTILPSYNQIGFDSLHYLVTLVEFDGTTGVGWVLGATAEGAPDPATKSTFPVRVTAADGGLHLKADGGMTLEAMGAVLAFDDFRITARLDDAGSAPEGATLAVSAICEDIPLYGSFLRTMGFCNPDTDQLHVFGGALLDARPAAAPVDVGPVGFSVEGNVVSASFEPGFDPADHSLGLLLLDAADGTPLALDYGTGTVVEASGPTVTVSVPAPGRPDQVRAWVLVDGFPAASGDVP